MSINITRLNHVYSAGTPFEKKALNDVSLNIEKGEYVGLIGHTGSGKSTLIQHINGLLKPFSGTVEVNGVDINSRQVPMKTIRQQVGLVFQYPEHQLFEMTVFKDTAFGPVNMGLSEEEVDRRVREALSIVGIGEELHEASPFELSGGQKRRVAIAGVLAMQPDILILDEPTAGLDPKGRDEILHEVDKLHEKLDMTVILVSHSMEDIANHVDRLVVMDAGSIRFDGSPRVVFKEQEALEEMGLAVPQVAYLAKALRERGIAMPDDIITIQEAVAWLSGYMDEKGGRL